MTRPASLFYREGGRVRALPLQYMKITAAMQLMRKAEEEMGQRFAFVVRPGWVDHFRVLSPYLLTLKGAIVIAGATFCPSPASAATFVHAGSVRM